MSRLHAVCGALALIALTETTLPCIPAANAFPSTIAAPQSDNARSAMINMLTRVAAQHDINPQAFIRIARLESGLNPRAFHPRSKASGLFQFIPSTARLYGLTNAFDSLANAEAAARLYGDNRRALRRALGREPTAGEVYLAHQQGSRGAIALLANPHRLAAEIVGRKAVTMNGGGAMMTAAEFAALWIRRFGAMPS